MPNIGIQRSKIVSGGNAMLCKAVALAVALGLPIGAAQARITEIRLDAPEPFAEGHAFGEVGSYLRITGVAKGELDPTSAQNQMIVDLDKAPRNARGMV